MQAATGTTLGEVRYLLGYYSASNIGGGLVRRTDSGATVNGGTIFPCGDGGTARWERVLTKPVISVGMFGAKNVNNASNGATNRLAFTACLDFLSSLGSGTMEIEGGWYNFDSTTELVWHCDRVAVKGQGFPTLDGSASVSGNEFVTITSATTDANLANLRNNLNPVENILFYGGPLATTNPACGVQYGNGTTYAQQTSMKNCVVQEFAAGIRMVQNTWSNVFDTVVMRSTTGTCFHVPSTSGGANGERYSLINCTTAGGNEHIRAEDGGGTNVHLIEHSFDYGARLITALNGSKVFVNESHIEDEKDTDYWFYVSGADSLIQIRNTEWVVGRSPAPAKSAFTIAYSNSNVGRGGLDIRDCSWQFPVNYTMDICSGSGRRRIENNTQRSGSTRVEMNFQGMKNYTSPDANYTIKPWDHRILRLALAFAANRVYTLPSAAQGAKEGDWFRVIKGTGRTTGNLRVNAAGGSALWTTTASETRAIEAYFDPALGDWRLAGTYPA